MAANDEELSPEDMGRLLNGTREDIMELLDTKKVRTEEGELEDWDVNTLVISDTMSLVHHAAHRGDLEFLKWLIEDMEGDPEVQDAEGRRPLHYAVTAFTTNLSQGVSDLSTLKYLVEDKQVNPNAADNMEWQVATTPVDDAIGEAQEYLKEKIEEYDNQRKEDEDNEMKDSDYDKLYKGNVDDVREIFKKKRIRNENDEFEPIDVNSLILYGETLNPLHAAAERGDIDSVKCLIEEFNAKPDAHDYCDRTPLYIAIEKGHHDVMKLLIEEYGADPEGKSIVEERPLHAAVNSLDFEAVKYLVEEHYVWISHENRYGASAFDKVGGHTAVQNGTKREKKIANYLLHYMHEELEVETPEFAGANKRVLGEACVNDTTMRVKRCLDGKKFRTEEGEYVDVDVKKVRYKNGNTPLHIAASYGCLRVAKLLLDKYGADPHQQNEGGNTPLHNACMYGHLRVADMLISDYSADINAEGYQRNRPLHLAARRGHVDVVKILISEFGAEVDPVNERGETPLHRAAEQGRLPAVRSLVGEHGADTEALTNEGKAAWQLAKEASYNRVVKYLNPDESQDLSNMVLTKISGRRKEPKTRIFKFTENAIFYKDENDQELKGTIPAETLQGVSSRTPDGFFFVHTRKFHKGGYRLGTQYEGDYERFKAIVKCLMRDAGTI